MKKAAFAAVALIVAALSITAGSASADNVHFGVNDDEGMFEKGSGPFFSSLAGLGMHDNTITVRWDETSQSGFEDLGGGVTLQSFLPQAVAAAGAAGVSLTFDVYPRHSQAAGDPADNAPRFAAWLKTLAATYPSVTHYVVMNECNQPLFVQPQYDSGGKLLSAAACGQFLAAGYQALKSVNPFIFVWGLGLSPHGAKVDGRVHRDSDPFSFLAALGTWYRSSPYSGQKIMDGLDLHPYPIPQSVPFAQGNSNAYGPAFGVATLPLVYQAFYDAFNGTAQPTVGPGLLPVSLNEVGVQTIPTVAGYTGTETANWGIDGTTGSQAYQAGWYKQLIDAAQCDADITNVNIFKLIDQADLGTWQSGLYQLGWVPKSSAAVVQGEIANVTSCPTGPAAYWLPAGADFSSVLTNLVQATKASIVGPILDFFASPSWQDPQTLATEMQEMFAQILAQFTRVETMIYQLASLIGPPSVNLTGTVSLVPSSAPTALRQTSAAAAKPPAIGRSFRVTKGKRIVFPRLGKVRAGTYRLQVVLTPAAGGAPATILTPAFRLDARGNLSTPTKAVKKNVKKNLTKKQHARTKPHGKAAKAKKHS